MNKTERFFNEEIKNDIFVEQYKEDIYQRLMILFSLLTRRVWRIIKAEYDTSMTLKKKSQILSEIREEIDDTMKLIASITKDELYDLQKVVYDGSKSITEKILKDTGESLQIRESPNFNNRFYTQSIPIDKQASTSIAAMFTAFEAMFKTQIAQVVNRMGVNEGESLSDYQDSFIGAVNRGRTNLNASTFTAVAVAAGIARNMFFDRNKRIFDGYQWSSVIDEKTSDYCQERHLQVWYYNDPEKSTLPFEDYPPGHYRCRASTVGIFKGEEHIDGPSYREWLEDQPQNIQEQVLGKTRFDMYKAGDIPLDKFYSPSGQRLTLSELRDNITI